MKILLATCVSLTTSTSQFVRRE